MIKPKLEIYHKYAPPYRETGKSYIRNDYFLFLVMHNILENNNNYYEPLDQCIKLWEWDLL
jgi:hypothetical protein